MERNRRTWIAIGAGCASGVMLAAAAPGWIAGWIAWVALAPAAAVAIAWRGSRAGRLAVPLAYGVYLELLLIRALPFGIAAGQWGDPPPVMIGDSPVVFVALIAVPAFAWLLYAIRFGEPWGADRLPQHLQPLALVAIPASAFAALDFIRVNVAGVVTGLALDRGGGRELTAAAVQPGYDTAEEDRWQTRYFEDGTHDLAALDLIRDLSPPTREAAASGAEIVVWPEAAVWVDPSAEPRVGAAIRDLARASGVPIVLPYFVRDLRQGQTTTVLPMGTFTRVQPKQRPSWFLAEDGGNRRSPEPVTAGPTRLGTLLGVDNQGPRTARALADGGAELLASATHDWDELAEYQRASAAINAAATGTPLVRADWRYGSAIYSA